MFSLSPTTPPAAPDETVKDVSLASFKADVLEASKTSVVLVEFWATWCEPCKQLMPVLEKIARASNGVVRLAKLDIDRNQQIATQMGVQSVPAVFAFFQGRPLDGFAGALPAAQITAWLDEVIGKIRAAGGALGDAADDKAGLETALQQAADFLAAGDNATAHSIYTDILDMEPDNARAFAGLLRCMMAQGNTAEARGMFDAADKEITKDKAFDSVRAALELAEQASGATDSAALEAKLAADPNDHQARFDLALACYAAGKREEAVDHLLDIVRRARTWNEDAARKQLVKFFEAFGPTDALTLSARKRLSSILFS